MLRCVCLIAMGVLVGCATSQPVATLAPTSDELPKVTRPAYSIQADVAVDARNKRPHLHLVEPVVEPPLTKAEQAAVGEREPRTDLLLIFPNTEPNPQRVNRTIAGVSAGRASHLTPMYGGHNPVWTPCGIYGEATPASGLHSFPSLISGEGGLEWRAWSVGPERPEGVGIGLGSTISRSYEPRRP